MTCAYHSLVAAGSMSFKFDVLRVMSNLLPAWSIGCLRSRPVLHIERCAEASCPSLGCWRLSLTYQSSGTWWCLMLRADKQWKHGEMNGNAWITKSSPDSCNMWNYELGTIAGMPFWSQFCKQLIINSTGENWPHRTIRSCSSAFQPFLRALTAAALKL